MNAISPSEYNPHERRLPLLDILVLCRGLVLKLLGEICIQRSAHAEQGDTSKNGGNTHDDHLSTPTRSQHTHAQRPCSEQVHCMPKKSHTHK